MVSGQAVRHLPYKEKIAFVRVEPHQQVDIKSKQLGIPYGTAGNRLRKALLFKYVKKCHEDICFKCNKKIILIEDFTIEHKVPWQNKHVSLFWDLGNISFSHKKCNKRELRYPNGRNHGTRGKYDVEKCRCDLCRKAKSISRKQIPH